MPVSPGCPPPDRLLAHWEEKLGTRVRQAPATSEEVCITLFPLEVIEPERHAVPPEVHYEVLSKEAISRIPCPQPAVVKPGVYPCILKLSHGYSGTGNYFLTHKADEFDACGVIRKNWPGARTVRTEIIGSVRGDYCAQFYLTRHGDIRWIGATDQVFDTRGRWNGAGIQAESQPELLDRLLPVVRPVAEYLHARGYFGLTGVDILRDTSDRLYVIDLNPRINGSTPFLLMFLAMRDRGLSAGRYYAGVHYEGNAGALLEAAERPRANEEIVVLSYFESPDTDTTECHVAVFGETLTACRQTFRRLLG